MKNHWFIKKMLESKAQAEMYAFENKQTEIFNKKVFFASFISMLVLLLGFLEDWRYGLLAVVAFPFSFMFYGERLASVEKKATEKSLEEAWLDESLKLLGESSLANFYSIGEEAKKLTAHKEDSPIIKSFMSIVFEKLKQGEDDIKKLVIKDEFLLAGYKASLKWFLDVAKNEEKLRKEMESLEYVKECSVYDDEHDSAHNPNPSYKRVV